MLNNNFCLNIKAAMAKPPVKQITISIIGLILIVMSMSIVFYLTKENRKETFLQSLPLAEYNSLQNSANCQREFMFNNYPTAKYNVSERAVVSQLSPQTCSSEVPRESLPFEYSIIEDGSISYSVQMLCFDLRFRQVAITKSPEHMYINICNETRDDLNNLINVLLSNPLYMEINDSYPYMPVYSLSTFYFNSLSNMQLYPKEKTGDLVKCVFRRMIEANQTGNEASKYPKSKDPLKSLERALLDKSDDVKIANVKVYYLEAKEAQTSGIIMDLSRKYVAKGIETVRLYKNNYLTTMDRSKDEFFFNQKMYILMQNSELPIFTFAFTINVPKKSYNDILEKQVEILKVYTERPLERYTMPCRINFQPLDRNNANILSCTVFSSTTSKDAYVLSFLTSHANRTGSCSFPEPSALRMEIPMSDDNDNVQVVVTVSPYEKIALCKWTSGGVKQFTFKRTDKCNVGNDFKDSFTQNSSGGRLTDVNMNLTYDSKYVVGLKRAQIGHTQYLSDYHID